MANIGCGFLQPGAEPLGLINVPESQGDFDAGHQQPCACQPVPPGQGGTQARPRRLVLPGGMLEQRLARLRFGPQLPCPGVSFLGAAAVPAKPAYFAQLVVGLARHPVVPAHELRRTLLDRMFRRVPATFDAQQLQPVDAADAGIHHVSHELLAPLLGGVSPGTHPVQVGQLVARVDHRAVDFSCPFRRHPAGEYRKHCLVQLGKAGCGAAAAQVCQAGEHQTEGCECGDAQAPAQILQLGRGLPRRAKVRETKREAGIQVEQIAVLRTFRKTLQ